MTHVPPPPGKERTQVDLQAAPGGTLQLRFMSREAKGHIQGQRASAPAPGTPVTPSSAGSASEGLALSLGSWEVTS